MAGISTRIGAPAAFSKIFEQCLRHGQPNFRYGMRYDIAAGPPLAHMSQIEIDWVSVATDSNQLIAQESFVSNAGYAVERWTGKLGNPEPAKPGAVGLVVPLGFEKAGLDTEARAARAAARVATLEIDRALILVSGNIDHAAMSQQNQVLQELGRTPWPRR